MRLIFPVLVIAVILLVTAGCTQNLPVPGPGIPSLPGETPAAGNSQVPSVAAGGKVIAAYWYLYPDPNDDTYPFVMQAKDRIPWTKINRLYIGFATVKDGELTDLPAGDSSGDTARRAEMRRRIREIVALCRQNNPDAEIFIVSNFDENELDPEYLLAAQDPQRFADSVADYLKTYDLDGYDMDWESGRIDDYAPQLTSLLSTCHATFAAAGTTPRGRSYLLTHTVWPGVESADTVGGLNGHVDQLNLMTYGPGETYDLASYAASYNASGIPYDLMIGGIESEDGYPENGGHDTEESVSDKCAFVREHGLAGLFEWRIDNDMRPDGKAPTYQVTGWMSGYLEG